ncbi:hypothetical protein HPB49_019700 [Dermacentor silvarum]|uniref:Uncharacterized protein n=1 Tax=Dermacentor silvarum TaxID=543639 RepID=A0ACB8E280_DERSI|nr:hypothetical protein HPB49_019700 [Dermacentor silvarum]
MDQTEKEGTLDGCRGKHNNSKNATTESESRLWNAGTFDAEKVDARCNTATSFGRAFRHLQTPSCCSHKKKRRSVAVRNPKETNQRVSSRPGKLWRSLSATSKEPYQRKAAEAAAVHRRKYPDYVYNARGARRRKEQQHRVKEVAGKLRNDGSGDQEQQPSTSTVQGQGASQFH